MRLLYIKITFILSILTSPFLQATNVILIMADDAGLECFNTIGISEYNTPNIDALAAKGAKFTNVHSQPLCTPSRVQIMTGKYNVRNYIDFGQLDPNQKTFGNYFKENGYKTSIVGKWQLSNDTQNVNIAGFDDYLLWHFNQGGLGNGKRYLSAKFTNNGFPNVYFQEYGPDIELNYIKDFITSNKDSSFFLYYPMNLPHYPFVPTPKSSDWPSNNTEFNNFYANYVNQNNSDPTVGITFRGDTTYFSDMVYYMDSIVGEIAQHLDSLQISDETLFIFTTDNGTDDFINTEFQTALNSYNIQGSKATATYLANNVPIDLTTRVPMVAVMPGTIDSGLVIDNIVDFSDVLPTILEAANINMTSCEIATSDGISFWSQLDGSNNLQRDISYTYFRKRVDEQLFEYTQDNNYKYRNDTLYFKPPFPGDEIILNNNNLTCIEIAIRDRLKQFLSYYSNFRYVPCLNCNLTVAYDDADGDGISDVQDVCFGFDDKLIGYPCDDGDHTTSRDIYMPNCNCEGIPINVNNCFASCIPSVENGFIQLVDSQLKVLDPLTGFSINIGNNLGFKPSAIGLNSQDGLIYGNVTNNSFDSNGNAIQPGDIISIDPLSSTVNLTFNGNTFLTAYGGDVENGIYYFNAINKNDFYAYEIANSGLSNLTNNGLHDWNIGDIVVSNGIAYGLKVLDNTTLNLYRADLFAGNIITEIIAFSSPSDFTGTAQEQSFGSAYISKGERLFFRQNQGGLYELTGYDGNAPELNYIIATAATIGGNDGTSCRDLVMPPKTNCISVAQNGFIQLVDSQLKVLDPMTGYSINIGNNLGFKASAIGLNSQDGLIYGNVTNNSFDSNGNAIQPGDIISIDPSSSVVNLVYDGTTSLTVYGGDVENGIYYFNAINENDFYAYNISSGSLNNLSSNGLHDWNIGDIIVLNGVAYGLKVLDNVTLNLYRANLLANNIITEIIAFDSPSDFTGTAQEQSFGSAYISLDNRLFFRQNQGGLYALNGFHCNGPQLTLVVNTAATIGGSDGTSCRNFEVNEVMLSQICSKEVDTNTDYGLGSIRSAINCAMNNDTILFKPILYNTTIELGQPTINIDKNLTFYVPPTNVITISNKSNNAAISDIKIFSNVESIGLNFIGNSTTPIKIKLEGTATFSVQIGELYNVEIE